VKNENNDRKLKFVNRIALAIGSVSIVVSLFLGDSPSAKFLLVAGCAISLAGGISALIFLVFTAIAKRQNRAFGLSEDNEFRSKPRFSLHEFLSSIRRGVSDVGEKTGLRPRTDFDARVIKKVRLTISMNDIGVSLSAVREGVSTSRYLLASCAELGDQKALYSWTIANLDHYQARIEPPLLLPVNKERVHITEVNFPWFQCRQSDAHELLLRGNKVRQQLEGKKISGKSQNGDDAVVAIHPFFYELSGERLAVYESLLKCTQAAQKGSIWYDREVYENIGIERWKGQSGAQYTVDRKRAGVRFRAGSGLEVNRDVLSFRFNLQEYAVLPDAIVVSGKKVFPLSNVNVYSDVRAYVLPEKKVPKGSAVTRYTWEFVNKDGSPDRRYSENERQAVIDVSEVAIGVNGNVVFSVVFSNVSAGQQMAQLINQLVELAISS